ncbi:T6SS immunity protein Tli4 family protein [Paraburkholderia lacunae]|uniref:Tle cognate immunity protein 4 C-terminal domain-containing protein n=1 Tax=Paraburkholderia lacunae TaxID=2211104 RepID=A0A370N5M6_9BURK|nr:T6SS immunity protein Tli4 family protein [Paraburkholderia lacunae]RDK00910.1 hypothetical protein DLM46_21505 [Paraburkholderia lacunae]
MASRKFVAALCAAIVTTVCYAKGPAMSDTKTYCFGRYLVDVPVDAQINGQAYEYDYGQINVSNESTSKSSFEERMRVRATELKAGKQKDGFLYVGDRHFPSDTYVFELSRKLITRPASGFEIYKWDQGGTYSMQGVGYAQDKISSVISGIQNEIFAKLKFRDINDIPTRSGFCLKNGFITDDGSKAQHEDTGISFKFARWPGVLVSVHTMTVTKLGEPKLLERINSAPVPDALKGVIGLIKTLRKGNRTVNGREGEEILETYPTDLGFRTHQFRWEAQGTQVSEPLKPTLIVEFESGMFKDDHGNPLRPNITDEQAVEIFDAVVNSIRLRPTSGGKMSSVESSAVLPLGTLVQTGSICPQTGWWTCPEANGHEVVGGGRQRFVAGSVMPVATVLGSQNFADRLLGKRPQYNVNTTWQLVGFDQVDGANTGSLDQANTDPA